MSSASAQTISEGLDNPPILAPFTTESELINGTDFPAGEWAYTTGTTHDGNDSITSSLPNRSSSQLNATIQGPAIISFWWKMNGLASFDTFQFSSRNDFAQINGNTDWQQRSFEVDTGSQPLNWYFERLSSTPVDTQNAWLDQLVVTPIPNNPELQAAVENFSFTLHSSDWTTTPLDGAINSTAAKSGPIAPNEISTMVFEIEGPVSVTYRWGIAGDESDESTLTLRVNNQVATSISGAQGLSEASLDLGPGTHAVKFTFQRGYNSNPEYVGPTEGYVDQLITSQYGASPTLADAVDRDGGVYSNSWTRQTQVTRDGSDAAMVISPEIYKARRVYLELPDEPGLLSFWYKMDADKDSGYLFALIDGEQILNTSGSNDWTKMELNLGTGFDRVLQLLFIRYTDPNANSPNSRAYLDNVSFISGATNFQPDLSIGPLKKRKKGAGLFNPSGAGQISNIRAPRTRPVAEHVIRVQNNSSTDADTISLRGVGSRRHFKVYYIVAEGGRKLNFSAAFAAGIFETNQLAAKGAEEHELWIVQKRKSARKRSHTYQVIGKSKEDTRKVDAVRTKLFIKKR